MWGGVPRPAVCGSAWRTRSRSSYPRTRPRTTAGGAPRARDPRAGPHHPKPRSTTRNNDLWAHSTTPTTSRPVPWTAPRTKPWRTPMPSCRATTREYKYRRGVASRGREGRAQMGRRRGRTESSSRARTRTPASTGVYPGRRVGSRPLTRSIRCYFKKKTRWRRPCRPGRCSTKPGSSRWEETTTPRVIHITNTESSTRTTSRRR